MISATEHLADELDLTKIECSIGSDLPSVLLSLRAALILDKEDGATAITFELKNDENSE